MKPVASSLHSEACAGDETREQALEHPVRVELTSGRYNGPVLPLNDRCLVFEAGVEPASRET
jgi:hypothetical protein